MTTTRMTAIAKAVGIILSTVRRDIAGIRRVKGVKRIAVKRLLTPLLAALQVLCAAAYGEDISFKHYSVGEGLSQSTVRAITQDKLGNLWFGTQNGLSRFNGHEFHIWRTEPSDSLTIADNSIYSLLIASDGNLWIGTASGLTRMDRGNGSFHNYSPTSKKSSVYDIVEKDGELFLATDDGLSVFNMDSGRCEEVRAFQGRQIRGLCLSDDGLLVSTKSGLFSLGESGALPIGGFVSEDISSIVPASGNSGFWIGTYNGLVIYDELTGEFTEHRHSSSQGSLSHDSIWSIFIDDLGGTWIGTYFGGLNYCNNLSDRFRMVSCPGEDVYGFISCMTTSSKGNSIWIGTNDDGLFLYDADRHIFDRFSREDVRVRVPGRLHRTSSVCWRTGRTAFMSAPTLAALSTWT